MGPRRYGPKRLITGPDIESACARLGGAHNHTEGSHYIYMPKISTSRQPLYKLFGQPTVLNHKLRLQREPGPQAVDKSPLRFTRTASGDQRSRKDARRHGSNR